MRFSILLPTKDRVEYLRHAIRSVQRQDYGDWEVIVADNASTDAPCEHVTSLHDPRVRCIRSEKPLAVTDNWNAALAGAAGEYVLMLGDDDALLPHYLTKVDAALSGFDDPELVYTSAVLYSYAGVDGLDAGPRLRPYGYATFLRNRTEPFLLDRNEALAAVRGFTRFRVTYGYNMQFALFSRRLIKRLEQRGPVYQSPFPDYYAMNAAMLAARSVLVVPDVDVLIGITPKSYGFFLKHDDESTGKAFLEAPATAPATPDPDLLPGTNINNSWLRSAEVLVSRFPEAGLRISRGRYRRLQVLETYRSARVFMVPSAPDDLRLLHKRLSRGERAVVFAFVELPIRMLPTTALRSKYLSVLQRLHRQFLRWEPPSVVDPGDDATGVYDRIAARSCT